jgi:hypothetical protein
MTAEGGQSGVRDRSPEVADYLAAVREALADLSPSERDELLEDLSAHLAEVAAEDPAPLRDRLGPPAGYAAELRAAADPAVRAGHARRTARLAGWWGDLRGGLGRLDARVGPLFGYQRASEFGRLLVPGWWVLRGYLAAMVVVAALDRSDQVGLLPRLGGSTLAGLLILAAAVAGSVWLARRTPDLRRWQRRAVYGGSAFLVLFGLIGFVDLDGNQRFGSPTVTEYVSQDPLEYVQDVYVVDRDGQLVTEVMLLDQHGNPLDIGWVLCGDQSDRQFPVRYPRCPEELPPWLRVGPPEPEPSPSPGATPEPSRSPEPTRSPTPDGG